MVVWDSERWAPLREHDETLKRLIAAAMAPLLDAGLFCALIGYGLPLRSSHIASFTAGAALNYLLKVRSTVAAERRTRDWRLHCRLLAVSLMALFLRGGVLGLLSLGWGWPAQVSIVFAVLAGLAVTMPGYAEGLSSADAGARALALAIGIIAYAFVLRLVYLGSVELLPEEAYYWNYSRHLDIGYLDHPPMVAWLIKVGTAAFGQSQFGIRAGALCCGVITSVFTYRLTRNLFDEATALAAVVLVQALPFFFLSGLLMTPDAPLTAAWAASLYYLERALVAGRSSAWWRVGFWLGIGALSKYSIGLLVPVTLGFTLWDRKSRRWWRRWEPYVAALLAFAIFSPVILWNAQHEWASFAFQTSRRLAEAPRFALHKLVASALILITPTGVLAVAAALVGGGIWRGRMDGSVDGDAGGGDAARRRLFISLGVLVPLAVFALFSLRHEVKLDWTGAPWIVGMDRYAIASELAFYGAERTKSAVETSSAHLFEGIGLMYERWTPAELQEGRNLLLVAWDPGDLTGKIIESHAERLGPIEDDVLREDGRIVRHYYHRLAYHYRTIPTP